MKTYRITYKQKFMGKVIQDSYIRTVRNEFELEQTVDALYEDSHVFSVTYEEVSK